MSAIRLSYAAQRAALTSSPPPGRGPGGGGDYLSLGGAVSGVESHL